MSIRRDKQPSQSWRPHCWGYARSRSYHCGISGKKAIIYIASASPAIIWRNHGTNLRSLRQRSAIWKQYQSRAQRPAAALECQPAASARQGSGRQPAYARLRQLSAQRQSYQGLVPADRILPSLSAAERDFCFPDGRRHGIESAIAGSSNLQLRTHLFR